MKVLREGLGTEANPKAFKYIAEMGLKAFNEGQFDLAKMRIQIGSSNEPQGRPRANTVTIIPPPSSTPGFHSMNDPFGPGSMDEPFSPDQRRSTHGPTGSMSKPPEYKEKDETRKTQSQGPAAAKDHRDTHQKLLLKLLRISTSSNEFLEARNLINPASEAGVVQIDREHFRSECSGRSDEIKMLIQSNLVEGLTQEELDEHENIEHQSILLLDKILEHPENENHIRSAAYLIGRGMLAKPELSETASGRD